MNKTVYIAGPITGIKNYWEPFEKAEDVLSGMGFTVLTPTRLPGGMSNAQYMRMCLAMIDAADAVLFLPDFDISAGARLEMAYCNYINKPAVVTFAGIEVELAGKRLREVLNK